VIYLDYNATTPLLPEAWEAMRPLMMEAFGNPSSAHSAGRKARQALEDARERIAALLGAFPDEVTFTSGATEANNLAVLGLGNRGDVLASRLEHPCVAEPLQQLEARGIRVDWLPVSPRGIVMPDVATARLRPETALICIMLANHETGAIQPVREIASALPSPVAIHCDAAQAVGKIGVNFHELGVTTLTASAHKFGGPKGVGVLLAKRGTKLPPLMFGGHQQQGRRPGTEPVPLAVGMAAALEWAVGNQVANHAKLIELRRRLWEGLRDALRGKISPVLNGPEIGAVDVVPTTLNVSFPGCRADLLLLALDLAGVACSTGSACSSGSLLPSPAIAAMGVLDVVLRSALRFSLSAMVEAAAVEDAVRRIAGVASRMVGQHTGIA
jgi:cysteine desulfurase